VLKAVSSTVVSYTELNKTSTPDDFFVAAMQGYFVKTGTNPQVEANWTPEMQLLNANNSAFYREASENPLQRISLQLTLNNEIQEDLLVAFSEELTEGFDPMYDAQKLFFGTEKLKLYTEINEEKFGILALPLVDGQREIPLSIESTNAAKGSFQLEFLENVPEDVKVYLLDKKSGLETPLNVDSSIEVELTKGLNNDRFSIVLRDLLVASIDEKVLTSVRSWYGDGEIHIDFADNNVAKAKVALYTVGGQKVWEKDAAQIEGNQLNLAAKINDKQLYLLKIETNKGIFTGKVIKLD
jgi:hypothetical protein